MTSKISFLILRLPTLFSLVAGSLHSTLLFQPERHIFFTPILNLINDTFYYRRCYSYVFS